MRVQQAFGKRACLVQYLTPALSAGLAYYPQVTAVSGVQKQSNSLRRPAIPKTHTRSVCDSPTLLFARSTSRDMTSASSSSAPQISLTPQENALCQLLDDACRWIETKQPQPDADESGGATIAYNGGWRCEARIAGGWVRDKLLGLESHDLDIALSSLTGHIFALLLRAYLMSPDFASSAVAQEPGSPFAKGSSSSSQLVGHITKIAANPEQSKNLETATATVAGLQLDFVNLRKEVYVGNSRIPTMTFGTALEDAQRRDITINALFYNLQTRQVEDLTGMGLADMRARVVRTPLEPQQTFLDDPLRVLRCVRFASRLGYKVHEDITQCLVSSEQGQRIRSALESKVSRERFGIEIDKMMLSRHPAEAIDLIEDMGLFEIVFGPVPGDAVRGRRESSLTASSRARSLVTALWREAEKRKGRKVDDAAESTTRYDAGQELASRLSDAFLTPLLDKEARRLLYYSSTLLPLRDLEWEERKGKWFWAGECVIAKGLKLGVKDTREPLLGLHRSSEILSRPTEGALNNSSDDYRGKYVPNLLADAPITARSLRALLMRLPQSHKPDSGLSAQISLLWAFVSDYATLDNGTGSEDTNVQRPYVQLFEELEAEGVFKRLDEKPLLDGKEACELLQTRPGKPMAFVLKRVEAWQFDRDAPQTPEERAQLKEACKSWLKAEWDAGGIVPVGDRDANAPAAPPKKKNKATGPK